MADYAIDDTYTVTETEVAGIVRTLCISYSSIRRSFLAKYSEIHNSLEKGDTTETARLMGSVFNLPSNFLKKVGYSATIEEVASVQLSFKGPEGLNGTPFECILLFRNSKSSLCKKSQPFILHAIAHELSHARLILDRHTLRHSEFATDVLAVIATGTPERYFGSVVKPGHRCGYIRPELYKVLFVNLLKHVSTIYL